MSFKFTSMLALGLAVLVSGAAVSQASPVTWVVDSSASSISFAIPDQAVDLNSLGVPLSGTVRIRNANNSTWTGNVARYTGTINTDFNKTVNNAIQFLPGSNVTGLNSGSYRPDPSTWNGTGFPTAAVGPSPYGAKVRMTVVIVTIDALYLAMDQMAFDMTSGALPIVGGALGLNGTTNLQLTSGRANGDGLAGNLLGTPYDIPDFQSSLAGLNQAISGAPNTSTVATGVYNPVIGGSYNRKMTLAVRIPIVQNLSGLLINMTIAGTITAYALVPEPATFALAGFGAIPLGFLAWRRRKRA